MLREKILKLNIMTSFFFLNRGNLSGNFFQKSMILINAPFEERTKKIFLSYDL